MTSNDYDNALYYEAARRQADEVTPRRDPALQAALWFLVAAAILAATAALIEFL